MPALSFRHRLLLVLVCLGAIPTAAAVLGWALSTRARNPATVGRAALEDVGASGRLLLGTLDSTRLAPAERAALSAHAATLNAALIRSQRAVVYGRYYYAGLALAILGCGALVIYLSLHLAGHLSRQLSRPIDELVGWTARIRDRAPLPPDEAAGGAPEFASLRHALREMAAALDVARARELEAERLRAFKEMARRVAHEMKNPLTPMRLAVAQLASNGAPSGEALEVLRAESARLEEMAREFTEFGRLPEGPEAEVDLAELLEELTRTSLPPGMEVRLELDPATPCVHGHYDPLRRALGNILRNAAEACEGRGRLDVRLAPAPGECDGGKLAEVTVSDHGPGIDPAIADRLFEPYVTGRAEGTGLGLALVRQTVEAHGGTIGVGATPGGGATFTVRLPGSAA